MLFSNMVYVLLQGRENPYSFHLVHWTISEVSTQEYAKFCKVSLCSYQETKTFNSLLPSIVSIWFDLSQNMKCTEPEHI